jgi:hypothetical protein
MSVILADEQFLEYYQVDANRSGVIATIPWATTGGFPKRKAQKPIFKRSIRYCAAVRGRNVGQFSWTFMGAQNINRYHDYRSVGRFI